MPTTGQSVHVPPNQCWTVEYQRSVVGRKTKPRMGHSSEVKRPSNQWLKNQRRATASRGIRSARAASKQANGFSQIAAIGLTIAHYSAAMSRGLRDGTSSVAEE